MKGQFHNKMHLFETFWLYKSLPDGTFYNSPFLGCLTRFWSFKTVSLWKVVLFKPKGHGPCVADKMTWSFTRSCKISGLCLHQLACRCHFLTLWAPEIPFEIFLITCSQSSNGLSKEPLMQNAARVQWEDAQLWIFEEEDFLVNPFEPRFWETASLHNCKDSIVCSCFNYVFWGPGLFLCNLFVCLSGLLIDF